jgi:hypothetical protein
LQKKLLRINHLLMKKNIFFALFFAANCCAAQSYNTAGGIRLGTDLGLTFQQYIANNWTAELILSTTAKSLNRESGVSLLGEKHKSIFGRSLNAYFGLGLYRSFVENSNLNIGVKNPLGITGIGGLEFSSGDYNFSLDYRPQLNLNAGTTQNIYTANTALSVRYIFKKRETNFQAWKKKQKERFKK